MPSTAFAVDFHGAKYTGDLSNYIDWNAFFQGGYSMEELALLDQLARLLRRPIAFYDIGANIGHHSLFMAARVDQVIAFEPYPAVRDEMIRKLDEAGITNASVHPVALGAATATLPYAVPAGANQGTGSIKHVPDNASGTVLEVAVEAGDSYLRAHGLPPIGLLKIDVEGFESEVLAGLRETIFRDRPPILMEISGADRSGFKTEEGLRAALYPDARLFAVRRSRGGYALHAFSMDTVHEALILPGTFSTASLPRAAQISRLAR
jgi:FkbM family methyltransferase